MLIFSNSLGVKMCSSDWSTPLFLLLLRFPWRPLLLRTFQLFHFQDLCHQSARYCSPSNWIFSTECEPHINCTLDYASTSWYWQKEEDSHHVLLLEMPCSPPDVHRRSTRVHIEDLPVTCDVPHKMSYCSTLSLSGYVNSNRHCWSYNKWSTLLWLCLYYWCHAKCWER